MKFKQWLNKKNNNNQIEERIMKLKGWNRFPKNGDKIMTTYKGRKWFGILDKVNINATGNPQSWKINAEIKDRGITVGNDDPGLKNWNLDTKGEGTWIAMADLD